MASGMVFPEEWDQLIADIRSGDPTVAGRLSARERRADNFFATGTYKPTASQGAALTASTVAFATYGNWLRIGNWVWVQASFRSTSAGTLSNKILISVPPELLIAGVDGGSVASVTMPIGQFNWVDDSSAPDEMVTGSAFAYGNDMVAGVTSGIDSAAETLIYIGEGAATTVASGDWILMNVNYITQALALV